MIVQNLKNERNVEGLILLLEDQDPSVRKQAIIALEELGDVSCALPLVQRLRDAYNDLRIEACTAFTKMGNQAVEPLVEALKDQNWVVREGAVQALGKIGDTRAICPLIEALKDTSTKKISGALRSMGTTAFQPLIEALKNEDTRIRIGAAMILSDMKNPAAIEALIKVTKDTDPLVRQFARGAIHNIKHENQKKKSP